MGKEAEGQLRELRELRKERESHLQRITELEMGAQNNVRPNSDAMMRKCYEQ